MREFDFLVALLNLGRSFISSAQAVKFGVCLVCRTFKDRCLLPQRFILGIEFGVFAAQIANFDNSGFVVSDLTRKLVCARLLILCFRLEYLISLAHLFGRPGS
jgi:hypothetical protein